MIKNVMTVLDKLSLMDRFLFDETMEDPEAYQAAVSILLENETDIIGEGKIEMLSKPETEKELRISPELRAVRLDVVNMDKTGRLYYTEMQQKNTRNLQKRSRYYQAQLDVSLLEPGSRDFNKLNDVCFILIAPFDIFGKGLYRYTFEGVCRECPELCIHDGAVRIFINTGGTNREEFSKEFLDFMEYLTVTTDETAAKTESEKIRTVHRNVKKIRQSEKAGVKYMQLWEEMDMIKEDGYQAGLLEGRHEKLKELVQKKRKKGKSISEIAEELEEEESTIKELMEEK